MLSEPQTPQGVFHLCLDRNIPIVVFIRRKRTVRVSLFCQGCFTQNYRTNCEPLAIKSHALSPSGFFAVWAEKIQLGREATGMGVNWGEEVSPNEEEVEEVGPGMDASGTGIESISVPGIVSGVISGEDVSGTKISEVAFGIVRCMYGLRWLRSPRGVKTGCVGTGKNRDAIIGGGSTDSGVSLAKNPPLDRGMQALSGQDASRQGAVPVSQVPSLHVIVPGSSRSCRPGVSLISLPGNFHNSVERSLRKSKP